MEKKELGGYKTDPKIRKEIDGILKQNARNVANFGTKSKHDLCSNTTYKKTWKDMQKRIKELDPIFYNLIKKQD